MSETDDIIADAIAAIEVVRPGLPLLAAEVPEAALIAGPALTMLYEGLVALRAARAGESPEENLAKARASVTEAVQNLAALKFGAQQP